MLTNLWSHTIKPLTLPKKDLPPTHPIRLGLALNSNPFLSSWSVQTGQGSICGRHRRVWHNVRGVVQGQHSHHAGAAKQPSPLVINQIEKEGEEKPIKGWEWAKKENVKNAASISWSDFGSNQLQLCVIINLLGVFVGILYSLISDIFHIFQHNFSSMT